MKKKVYFSILIAVCMFVVTFAAGFVFNSIIPKSVDGVRLYEWRFTDGVSAQELETVTEYKQATQSAQVGKTANHNYMRLEYDFAAHSDIKTLEFTTQHSPMKVFVDNVEVFNNGYGTKEYTGGKFTSITLEASNHVQHVTVFLYTPLGFTFDAVLKDGPVTIHYEEISGLVLGCAVALVGLFLAVTSFCLKARSRGVLSLLLLSGTIILSGCLAVVYSLSGASGIFTNSMWLNIQISLNMIVCMMVYISILVCFRQRGGRSLLLSLCLFVLSIVALFIPNVLGLQLVMIGFAVIQIIFAVLSVLVMANRMEMKFPIVPKIILVYAALINVYNTISWAVGAFDLLPIIYAMGISVSVFVLYYTMVSGIVTVVVREDERKKQIKEDSVWIESVSSLIAKTFVQNNEKDFFIATSAGICDILRGFCYENGATLVCGTAIFSDNSYKEIYREGELPACDYAQIEAHLSKRENRFFVGSRYIEMLFESSAHPNTVIYIGGIDTGLNGNIANIMHTVYDNVSVAYDNLNLKTDMFSMQENLFIHLAEVVENKFDGTGKHLVTVSRMVEELCQTLGVEKSRAHFIATASITHDIGKIAIPESILLKEGNLTDEEFAEMSMHVIYGKNILSVSQGEFFDIAGKIALEHHENYDGTGYLGKKGEEISIYAQIVHVADVFDALLSKRSYKDSWSVADAVKYICDGAGQLFSPDIVSAFELCKDSLVKIKQEIESGGNEE